MLSEEEKKAIERLKERINDNEDYKTVQVWLTADIVAVNIVLNLITKLQKENEEKDKQIYELVKYIDSNNYVDNEECQFQWDFKIEKCIGNGDCKDCIKQYFETKAKGE